MIRWVVLLGWAVLGSAPTADGWYELLQQADHWLHSGSPDQAVTLYREVIELNPSNADAWFNLGYALHNLAQPEDAVHAFKEAARLKKGYDEWMSLGTVLEEQQRYGEASDAYSNATQVASSPDQRSVALSTLAHLLLRTGQPRLASAAFEATAAVRPSAENHFNHGVALMEAGDIERAKAVFEERALLATPVVGPVHARVCISLAQIAFDAGDLSETRARLLSAIQLDPANPEAYNNLGAVLTLPGERIHAFEAAIRLDPQRSASYNNLANDLRHEAPHALSLYQTAIALAPQAPENHYNFATVCGEAGDVVRQMHHFKAARRLWYWSRAFDA